MGFTIIKMAIKIRGTRRGSTNEPVMTVIVKIKRGAGRKLRRLRTRSRETDEERKKDPYQPREAVSKRSRNFPVHVRLARIGP